MKGDLLKRNMENQKIKQGKTKIFLRDNLSLGVATSSTQIEGGDKNNTWYKFSVLDKKIKDGSTSLRANSHYKNFKKDLDLMSKMRIKDYRFSIEWSRIEPIENKFNLEAIEHYKQEICYMKKLGIRPLVTLWHFSNPIWFDEKGGFEKEKNLQFFFDYVTRIVTELKDLVDDFCTLNEPNVYASSGYLFGDWPPEKKSFSCFRKVMKNYANAHLKTYEIIKQIKPSANVGFAFALIYFKPYKNNPAYRTNCKLIDNEFQWKLLLKMCGNIKEDPHCDFIGINYYRDMICKGLNVFDDPNLEHNDLGWSINPQGLKILINRVHSYFTNKEIYITENGIADKDDKQREKYLTNHLLIVNEFPFITRYYHWTFFDNFEWKEGESAKFGLIDYNFKNGSYKIRQSGKWYSNLIKNRILIK
mgnify:CR=1 FL=1